MRITTLTFKDFSSHVETNPELGRFRFGRGPNGCGKSSIQMALEYLFTGRCEMTHAGGRGAEAVVRAGVANLVDGKVTLYDERARRGSEDFSLRPLFPFCAFPARHPLCHSEQKRSPAPIHPREQLRKLA